MQAFTKYLILLKIMPSDFSKQCFRKWDVTFIVSPFWKCSHELVNDGEAIIYVQGISEVDSSDSTVYMLGHSQYYIIVYMLNHQTFYSLISVKMKFENQLDLSLTNVYLWQFSDRLA